MIDQKLIEILPTLPLIENPEDINESTRVQQDLQLLGFQGRAFIFHYSEVFNIDVSRFPYQKYFANDSTFRRLFDKYIRRKKDTLTIGELQKAIAYKKLNEKVLEHIRSNNPDAEPRKKIYLVSDEYRTTTKDTVSYIVIGLVLTLILGFVAYIS